MELSSALAKVKNTLKIRLWAWQKVPLLAWVRPRIELLTDDLAVISIPLCRRQKNHLGSMYFGVLACGADLAGGLLAVQRIEMSGKKVSFVFKDFSAEFLKRPESRTFFSCKDGKKAAELVEKAIRTKERVHDTVEVVATCPDLFGDEPVARFRLTLSLKLK